MHAKGTIFPGMNEVITRMSCIRDVRGIGIGCDRVRDNGLAPLLKLTVFRAISFPSENTPYRSVEARF